MTAAPKDPGRIAVHAAVIPTGAVAAPSSQTRGAVPAAAGAIVSAAKLAQVIPDHRQEPAVVLHRGSGGLAAQARSRRLRPATLIRVCSAAGAAFLLAWIVVLSATLPAQAVTHEWKLAWLGLDVAEAAGLLVMTWAARRQREMLILATIVTGTLLACDAWFDLILSWGTSDWRWSVLSAVALELPLAALLFAAARQMIRTRVAELGARMRPAGPPATDRRLARPGPPAQCPGRRGRSRRPGRTADFCPRTASRASGGVRA